ncbi:MAG: hypothetical protein AABX28_02605 [Nanoarchaeota archaeon]
MAKTDPLKIGFGAGAILLGISFVFNNSGDMATLVFGVIAIAFGLGLLASSQR